MKSNKVLIAVLLLLSHLACPAYSMASPQLSGSVIPSTPFDAKLASTGLFEASFSGNSITHSKEIAYNLFFTARSFRYTSDLKGDQWQSPQITERRRSGDCEDKAVWLYAQLMQSGHGDNARLVIGKLRSHDPRLHVWVQLQTESGETLVLDPSSQKRIWKNTDFSSDMYLPYYSYDSTHRYKHI